MDRTYAIAPVHVGGNVCNIEAIEHIARKYGLKVIYNAAHTFGVRYKGQGIGNFGDVSYFSFHETKVFNIIEGGAVCFYNPEFVTELYRLKNFGIRGPEVVDGVGANAKMNEFCAVMGICNLRHIGKKIAKYKMVVGRYQQHLTGIDVLQLKAGQKDVTPNYAYYPVIFDEKVYDALAAQGIGARKYFYPLTNSFNCFNRKYDVNKTPVALHISKRVLTLPIYTDLKLDDVNQICEIILSGRK